MTLFCCAGFKLAKTVNVEFYEIMYDININNRIKKRGGWGVKNLTPKKHPQKKLE